MTLEEAIKHSQDVAKSTNCEECRKQHKQLADWLLELKNYRKKESPCKG